MMHTVQNFSHHCDQVHQNPLTFQETCFKRPAFSKCHDQCYLMHVDDNFSQTIGSCQSHSFLTLVTLRLERLQDFACLCNAVYRTPFMESMLLMFDTHVEHWCTNENEIRVSDSSPLFGLHLHTTVILPVHFHWIAEWAIKLHLPELLMILFKL